MHRAGPTAWKPRSALSEGFFLALWPGSIRIRSAGGIFGFPQLVVLYTRHTRYTWQFQFSASMSSAWPTSCRYLTDKSARFNACAKRGVGTHWRLIDRWFVKRSPQSGGGFTRWCRPSLCSSVASASSLWAQRQPRPLRVSQMFPWKTYPREIYGCSGGLLMHGVLKRASLVVIKRGRNWARPTGRPFIDIKCNSPAIKSQHTGCFGEKVAP